VTTFNIWVDGQSKKKEKKKGTDQRDVIFNSKIRLPPHKHCSYHSAV